MFEKLTDAEFRRYVQKVCHTLAYQKYRKDNATASRVTAWKYAAETWQEFEERAIAFLTVQEAMQENGRMAREQLN